MRISTSSLLTLLIILCVLYIINEYSISKINKSSSASMKVINKDKNITINDNFYDDIHEYKSWSEEKINKFLQLKENHYEQRGARLNQYCHLQVK